LGESARLQRAFSRHALTSGQRQIRNLAEKDLFVMGFIQRELDRIAAALREPRSADEYRQLYAAQQALSWATDPTGFKPPYDAVVSTAEGSKDCPSECGQVLS
jgi:hypothetical protein